MPQEAQGAPSPVELELVPEAKVAVVKLRGEHDLTTKEQIAAVLAAATALASHVLVDLQECTFVDSSLVRVLVEARARFDRSVAISVVIPPSADVATRLAHLTSLEQVVPVYESREAATEHRPYA